MKVLITTDAFTPTISGVVTSVTNLNKELIRMGHDVRILTLSHNNYSSKKDNVYYIKSFGINVYPNMRATVSFNDKYLKEILEWGPDIIHSQCEFFTFVFAKRISKKLNIPIVHTYHTMYEHYTEYVIKNKTVGRKLVSAFSKGIANKVDVMIAPTEKVRESLINYGINKEIEVIPTGINLDKFKTKVSEEEKMQLKMSLGLVEASKIILSVGRLGIEKNIDEILRNLPMLIEKHKELTLLIVGDGPHRSSLESMARELNICEHVIFTGMIPPELVSKYYQIADIFVSASESETQGLTYIEALANGVPEVCKYDKCLEGVLISGYNGFAYERSQEFIEDMNTLLEDYALRSQMSANAVLSAEQFGSFTFVRSVESLYQNAVMKTSYAYAKDCYNYA
jgi:1,2-diacylglycerol 3-alpha-glucosyltransferase